MISGFNLNDTAEGAIARLDASLRRRGQDVTVRKSNAVTPAATVRALVRGIKASEVAGTITQTDKRIIISPTGLLSIGLPRSGWFVLVDGIPRAIIGEPELIKIADTVVRIHLAVKG